MSNKLTCDQICEIMTNDKSTEEESDFETDNSSDTE